MATKDSAVVWSRRRVLASLLGVGVVAPFVRGERGGSGDAASGSGAADATGTARSRSGSTVSRWSPEASRRTHSVRPSRAR